MCCLPSNITIEDIFNGRSESRNRVIATIFKELNLIEQWGSGIQRIVNSCKEYGLATPEIQEKNDFMDIEIVRRKENSQNETNQNERKRPIADDYGRLAPEDEKSKKPSGNRRESVGKASEEKSAATEKDRKRPIADDYGRLAPEDEKNNEPSDNRRITTSKPSDIREQEKTIIDFMVENGSLKSKKVEELLGIKESRSRQLLREMIDKNLIKRKGKGRATYYTLKQDNN